MIKTQIQLEAWQYAEVRARASQNSCSMSEVIREAVTEALKRGRPQRSLKEVAGKYAPLGLEDLKSHDAAWAESIR